MKKRGILQTLLWVFALISYIAAVGCGITIVVLDVEFNDNIIAGLMASIVFFAGVGIVLHVLANADLPDLRLGP